MQLLYLVSSLSIVFAIHYSYRLLSCYFAARKIGFPVVLTPVNPKHPLWLLLGESIRPALQQLLPGWLFFRVDLSTRGFQARLRNKLHDKLGATYLLVGPGSLEFWTSNKEIGKQILGHGSLKGYHQSKLLRILGGRFGPSIIGADGEDWQRQRKVIAPIINERISAAVWGEGIEQAMEMLRNFTKDSKNGGFAGTTDRSIEGLRNIAINVLGAATYGTPRQWAEEEEKAPAGHKLSYIEALLFILNHFAASMYFEPPVLRLPFMPSSMHKLADALTEYPGYVEDMIAAERANADADRNNIMTAMIKVSDQDKNKNEQGNSTSNSELHLSEPEIRGNMFLFTVAGFDTTANTMAFALALLAINPHWQDWLIEEIDRVIPSQSGSFPPYEQAYPKLKRVLAFMYETLRLYSPVEHLSRRAISAQTITAPSGTQHTLPADIDVFVSQACAHINPDYWAPDPLAFRPTRWLEASNDGLSGDTLIEPEKGTFFPWSIGPRMCPGMKMAQVEFVSVFAALFRHSRVEPALLPGEKTVEEARRRLEGVVADIGPVATLQILRPREVVLKWVRR